MGTKHDILTEDELLGFQVNGTVTKRIDLFLDQNPGMHPGEVNILDWGCGRGRSVAKLREQGFNAFGVDVDLKTMSNGYSLFESRGETPSEILKPVDDTECFSTGYFHVIFSEQVFEHVADLTEVAKEQARLTAPSGIGIHCFPGSKMIWEEHLHMPLVHWFPKNIVRKYWLAMMLHMRMGPKNQWPETKDQPFSKQVEVYFQCLNDKTYYRGNEEIVSVF